MDDIQKEKTIDFFMSPVHQQYSTAVALVQLIASLMKCTAATLIEKQKKHFNNEPQRQGEHAHHFVLIRKKVFHCSGTS